MKLSEQVAALRDSLNDNPPTVENVRDQIYLLADQVHRLTEATEAIVEYIYEQGTVIRL